jgi:hypothetical protein
MRLERLAINLNGRWHTYALLFFMAGIVAHISEHVTQAIQIYALGWETPDSRGLAGQWWPWLATSETLHYFYAVFTLFGIVLLLPAFRGTARFFWYAAFSVQVWHHLEHLLLIYQRQTGDFFFGREVPIGFGQLLLDRVVLHDVYNGLVFLPMIAALYFHFRAGSDDAICGCARWLTGTALSRLRAAS